MIEVVSRTLFPRLLAVLLLTGGLLCGRFALASATSVDDLLSGALTPSGAPALLGPITSSGRVGWECKPERAASSERVHDAELPADPTSP